MTGRVLEIKLHFEDTFMFDWFSPMTNENMLSKSLIDKLNHVKVTLKCSFTSLI